MVRGGKVEQRSGSLLNSLPAMEFCAMIRGNRFNLQGLPADEFNGSVFGGLLGFVGQFALFPGSPFCVRPASECSACRTIPSRCQSPSRQSVFSGRQYQVAG